MSLVSNITLQRQQTPTNQGTTLGAATGATARGRTEFPQLAALWPREWPGETSNDRRKRKINGGSSWPRPARAGRGGTCAVRREREKREYELPRFGGTVGTCLGEREREQRAVEVLAATRTHSLFPSLPPRTAPQCTPSWRWLCGGAECRAEARRGEAGWVSRVFRRFDELFSLGTRNLRFHFARAEHSQRQQFALGRESVDGATVRRQTAPAAIAVLQYPD